MTRDELNKVMQTNKTVLRSRDKQTFYILKVFECNGHFVVEFSKSKNRWTKRRRLCDLVSFCRKYEPKDK